MELLDVGLDFVRLLWLVLAGVLAAAVLFAARWVLKRWLWGRRWDYIRLKKSWRSVYVAKEPHKVRKGWAYYHGRDFKRRRVEFMRSTVPDGGYVVRPEGGSGGYERYSVVVPDEEDLFVVVEPRKVEPDHTLHMGVDTAGKVYQVRRERAGVLEGAPSEGRKWRARMREERGKQDFPEF